MSVSRRTFLGSAMAAPAAFALTPSLILAENDSSQSSVLSQTFQVGEVEVIALSDGYLPMPTTMMAGYDATAAKAAAFAAYQRHDGNMMRLGINGYVVRTGDRTIAVDCGTPKAVAPSVGTWHQSLAKAGIKPAEIDTIFLSHMHMDHVGGLGDLGQNNKLLANAQLITSQVEWDHTHSDAAFAQAPDMIKGSMQMARGLAAPYAADAELISMAKETEIAPGLTAVPMPGHTPGHMGLRIESGNEALLIWADALHVQAYQFAHPDWTMVIDTDLDQARKTRARLLDSLATDRLRVAGSHLDFPSLGYVERSGDAYRYVPSGADYS